VKGIICMMPAWQSPFGQWTSREIREVWRCSSAAGHSVVLADAAGERPDCGMVPDHEAPIGQELMLRIARRRRASARAFSESPIASRERPQGGCVNAASTSIVDLLKLRQCDDIGVLSAALFET